MKKIIALFISVILFTTMLSACGNKNNDNPSITAPTNSSSDNLTEQNGDSNEINWETENIEVPDIEDVVVSEITVPNTSVKIKIAKTPFNFNIENFKKAFDESKYISKLYTFATFYGESINGDTYKEGNKVKFYIENKVLGKIKNGNEKSYYFNDMEATIRRDTNCYDGDKTVYFHFSGVDDVKAFQDDVFSVLEKCIGKEYAEYLVYAKGNDTNTKSEMETEIKKDNATYLLGRKVEKRDDVFDVTFSLFVNDLHFSNSFDYYDGGYQSKYTNFKHKFSEVFPQVTDVCVDSFDKFSNEYFSHVKDKFENYEYVRTLLDHANFFELHSDDGKNVYKLYLETSMGCSNLSKLVSPELKYDMYIYENDNGEIENIDFSLEGETLPISNEEDKNTSYKYLASSQKSEIASLFPDIDVSWIDENKTEDQSAKLTYKILGKDCNVKAKIASGETFADTYLGRFKLEFECK